MYKILPTAGDSSINVAGWSLAQLMVTPEDISTTEYQPNDYRYAGSLFVTRSFHSYNPIKKFSYQSELLVGIRGPHALARQTQTAIHALINADRTAWLAQPVGHAAFAQSNIHRGEKFVFMEEPCGVERRRTSPGRLADGCSTYLSRAADWKDGTIF